MQAVLELTDEQEERLIEAYADMMARLSAIFAKHQSMLVALHDDRAIAAYSSGIGTTTVRCDGSNVGPSFSQRN